MTAIALTVWVAQKVKVNSVSREFSPFDSGSEGAIAMVELYQYKPVDSYSSGGSDSREGSSNEESAGAERLLNSE